MAPPKRGGDKPRHESKFNTQEVSLLVKAISAFGNIAERLGVAFAVIVLLFGSVWLMGSSQTKDDFIRELLFGSITNTRYLTFFTLVLVLIALLGVDTRLRSYRTESAEMKRLAAERTAWQERALGATAISHTEEVL